MSKSPFTLNSADDTFLQRQKSVFDQLNVIEKNANNTLKNSVVDEEREDGMVIEETTSPKRGHSSTRHFRGKESIFKKPQTIRTKNFFRKMPDFKKNPHKWTKYSLDDVKDEDISDKSNTKTALSFLKELESRSKGMECEDDDDDGEGQGSKIVFKKRHTNPTQEEKNIPDKSTFRSSKLVMPEYSVGQKASKDKKRDKATKPTGKGKELKLDHLLDEEDDE